MKNTPAPSAAAGAGGTAAPGGGQKTRGLGFTGGERSSQMDSHCCNVPGKFQREKSSPGNHEMVPSSQKSLFFTPNLPKPPLAPAPLERQRPGQAASSPRATNHKQHRSEAAEVLPPPLRLHSSLYHPQISNQSSPHALTPRSAFWLRASPAAGHGEEKPRGADPSPAQRQAARS